MMDDFDRGFGLGFGAYFGGIAAAGTVAAIAAGLEAHAEARARRPRVHDEHRRAGGEHLVLETVTRAGPRSGCNLYRVVGWNRRWELLFSCVDYGRGLAMLEASAKFLTDGGTADELSEWLRLVRFQDGQYSRLSEIVERVDKLRGQGSEDSYDRADAEVDRLFKTFVSAATLEAANPAYSGERAEALRRYAAKLGKLLSLGPVISRWSCNCRSYLKFQQIRKFPPDPMWGPYTPDRAREIAEVVRGTVWDQTGSTVTGK
jgi:hypothetical protein